MRKLKKQAEQTKIRKEQIKKEKGWVGGSTTPRDSSQRNSRATSPETGPVLIDTSGRIKMKAGFDFEALD